MKKEGQTHLLTKQPWLTVRMHRTLTIRIVAIGVLLAAALGTSAQDSSLVANSISILNDPYFKVYSLGQKKYKQFRLVEKCTSGLGQENNCKKQSGKRLTKMSKYFLEKNEEYSSIHTYGNWLYVVSFEDENTVIISGDRIVSAFQTEKYTFKKRK